MPFVPLFGAPGPWELLVILLIVIVIFGANKLPQLGAGLGEGIKNFKKSIKGEREELPSDEEANKKEG